MFSFVSLPRLLSSIVIACFAVIGLSACSGDSTDSNKDEVLTITDTWVKAEREGMTAAFGTIHNPSTKDLTITSVTSDASEQVQLHETVTTADHNSTMQEAKDGFVVPAGGNLTLEPGGNHIMLIGLNDMLMPGDEVTFTLHFDDGQTLEFTAIVKEFDGANESYESHGKH